MKDLHCGRKLPRTNLEPFWQKLERISQSTIMNNFNICGRTLPHSFDHYYFLVKCGRPYNCIRRLTHTK